MLYNMIIKNQTQVVPGTIMYKLNWAEVETPVFRKFFLFNVTNKEEFLAQTPGNYVKPIFQEIGPYVYREYLKKDNIEYQDYNSSVLQKVFYRQTATFFFVPELSNGTEDDIVTSLNIIVTLIPAVMEHVIPPGLLNTAYAVFNKLVRDTNSELLFTMTVGEYLFGFQDPLFTAILDKLFPEAESDIFGVFMLTNMSIGWRDYQVYTGKGDYKLTNEIVQFQNMSVLPYWFGETCNQINGTDGTMTAPFMNKEDRVYFYVDEMCRSIYATYQSEQEVHKIKGWRYNVPPDVFMSPANNEENTCFCADLNHVTCQHDGGNLVSSCLFGAPLFVTFPHFLYASDYYADKIVGMHPDEEKHQMYIIYEPTTGVVIDTESRIQLNLFMQPNSRAPVLNQIQEEFAFPMLWLNEVATLQESDASWFYLLLYRLDELVLLVEIVAIVVGSAFLGWAIGFPLYSKQRRKSQTSNQYASDYAMSPEKKNRKPVAVRTISTTQLVED
uniref:Scavenger receptor class B member 1 n=1 Tax=Phallusia mammillata TaxID=59560 RepID=A0A6F9D9K1_9ASCI|nr:platelet glycoprotein 4-like [Phallusia mammillata]